MRLWLAVLLSGVVVVGSFQDGLNEGLRQGINDGVITNAAQWAANVFTDAGNYAADKARLLRQWLFGEDPDADEPLPPPFSGGQCAVNYNVFARRIRSTGPFTVPPPGDGCADDGVLLVGPNLLGPIRSIRIVETNTDNFGFVSDRWSIAHGDGQEFSLGGILRGCPSAGFSDFSIVRVDGLPDVCGDPSPPLPPPAPINIDIDVTYGDNNEFNLTVPVVFGVAYVAIDGSVNIPVSLEFSPTLNLNGTLELFPDFNLNIGFPRGGDEGEGQPDPTPPPDAPPGEGEEGDPDEETPEEPESRVYGLLCRARIESDARPSGIFQEVGPDIYVPRLGSARFGTVVNGVTFWTEDIDIKGLDSVVQCPIPWGASTFIVNAASGVAINYTPISSAPKDWPEFLQLGAQFTSDNR